MFNTFILAISNNGKYITEESSPLSAQVNHFLNPAYFGSQTAIGLVAFFIIAIAVIIITRKK